MEYEEEPSCNLSMDAICSTINNWIWKRYIGNSYNEVSCPICQSFTIRKKRFEIVHR